MATALIGLGSNLGDRAAALEKAIERLREESQIRVEAVSSFRESKPAGGPEQGEFLNACARLETSLTPEELLARLLAIEAQVGRVREERWGPRVIDLDILLYDRMELKTPTLELPHPRMCYRRFVLEPAAEIAGEMVWPVNGWSVGKLRDNLQSTARYIAFGCVREDFERIIGPISQATNCRIKQDPTHGNAIAEVVMSGESHPPEKWVERVLAFYERSVESLAMTSWTQDTRWTISDYWSECAFEAATLLLELNCNHCDSEGFSRLRNHRLTIQQPRLVIIFENHHPPFAKVNKHFDELRRQADSPPSLWLSMDDPVGIAKEVLAAIQAME